MNCKIRPIDLKVGMFVIVSEWFKDDADFHTTPGMLWDEGRPSVKPLGDPMRVLSLALPLFIVELVGNGQRGCLDSRLMQLTKVDRAYVKALCPTYFSKVKKPTEAQTLEHTGRRVQRYVPGQGWKEVFK